MTHLNKCSCSSSDHCYCLKDVFLQAKDGQNLRVITSGNRKCNSGTLFFLHGLGLSASIWYEYQRYFGKHGFFTIALDMRGFGLSQPYLINNPQVDVSAFTDPAQEILCSLLYPGQECPLPTPQQTVWPYYAQATMDDINFVLDHFKVKKIDLLVGQSLGSYMVLLYNILYPKKVKKTTVFGVIYNQDAPSSIPGVPMYIYGPLLAYVLSLSPCFIFDPSLGGTTQTEINFYEQCPEGYFNFTGTLSSYTQYANINALFDSVFSFVFLPINGDPQPLNPCAPPLNVSSIKREILSIAGDLDNIAPIIYQAIPLEQLLSNSTLLIYSNFDHYTAELLECQLVKILRKFIEDEEIQIDEQTTLVHYNFYPECAQLPVQYPCPPLPPVFTENLSQNIENAKLEEFKKKIKECKFERKQKVKESIIKSKIPVKFTSKPKFTLNLQNN